MVKQSKSSDKPARVVLEGVPRIGFDVGGFMFPSSMRACMQFIGEDPAYDYNYIMGTSGAAFGLLWKRWFYTGDLTDHWIGGWLEPIDRAFDAVGYTYETVIKKGKPEDKAYFRRRIVESIRDKHHPVMAAGVVGPPCCNIITGYDEHGDILIGWSHFQSYPGHGPAEEFEPSGYFRKRDWYKDTQGLIIIGEKKGRPPLGDIHRKALRWALDVMRVPVALERHSGLKAYAAWAEDLLRDEDFPKENIEVLLERLDCHLVAHSVVWEGRWHAGQFLRRIAEPEPAMREQLGQAAICYDAEVNLMKQVSELQGGSDPHDERIARKLAEPAIRRHISSLILQARDKDEEAANHLERALAK